MKVQYLNKQTHRFVQIVIQSDPELFELQLKVFKQGLLLFKADQLKVFII